MSNFTDEQKYVNRALKSRIGFNPYHTRPRDVVAKRVVFDDGDRYDPKIKAKSELFSTLPLPIRPWHKIPKSVKNHADFIDFTGYAFGNFRVIGLFALHKFDKWVVRCSCGNYEIRSSRTLRKAPSALDQTRCQECMDLERIRHKEYFNQNGYYPWQKKKENC